MESVELREGKMINQGEKVETSYYLPLEAVERYFPSNLCKNEFWEHRIFSPHWRRVLRGRIKTRQESSRVNYLLPLDKTNLSSHEITAYVSSKGVGLTFDGKAENTIILLKEWLG